MVELKMSEGTVIMKLSEVERLKEIEKDFESNKIRIIYLHCRFSTSLISRIKFLFTGKLSKE